MRASVYLIAENVYGFTKTCIHCGIETEHCLSQDEYERLILNNEHVQDVFPLLEKEERELMISGIHPECWNEMFETFDEE